MKSLISVTLFLILINFISLKEERKTIPGILYEIGIGQNLTKIKMLLSTSTTNNTLFSNSNRRYALEIQEKRNKSILREIIIFNEVPIKRIYF